MSPTEDVYVDNLCFETCPDTCALVLDDELKCDTSGGYTYTFSILNNTLYTVDGIIINNQFDPNVNILPNGIHGPITINIPAGSYPTYCFDIVMFSENLECCHYEHCIDLPLCFPCDSIELIPSSVAVIGGADSCCVTIDVVNNFDGNYFTKIISTILTPGVNFTNQHPGVNWAVSPATGNVNVLTWTQTSPDPLIDKTIHPQAMNYCLTDISHISQTPQLIKFDWITLGSNGLDSVVCSDTIPSFCEPCLNIFDETITCLPNGDYQYCMTIANNDPVNAVTEVYFDVYTPTGLQFSPNSFSSPPTPLIPPLGTATFCVTLPGPPSLNAGDQVKYKIILKNFDGGTLNWCCIVDTFCIIIPECNVPEPCPQIVDHNVECINDINGDGKPDYKLTLNVTGTGTIHLAPWPLDVVVP